jgi:hypothetical protein
MDIRGITDLSMNGWAHCSTKLRIYLPESQRLVSLAWHIDDYIGMRWANGSTFIEELDPMIWDYEREITH